MFRALYSFNKTHPTSLTFSAGDTFIGLPGASADKNWYYVLDVERGLKGFVPRNYVQPLDNLPTLEEFNRILDGVRDKVIGSKIPDKERGDTLAKIELLRTEFCPIPRVTPLDQPDGGRKVGGGLTASANSRPDSRGPSPGGRSDTSSTASRGGRESTPPKQLSGGSTAKKKAPAPKPPVTKTKEDENTKVEPAAVSTASSSPRSIASEPHIDAKVTVSNHAPAAQAQVEKPKPKQPSPNTPITNVEPTDEIKKASNSMDATNSIGCVNINGPVVGPSIASVVEKHVGATRKNSVQFIRKASRSNSIATEMSPDQIRAEARELVEVVREMTGLSHMASQATARTVLNYVCSNLGKLEKQVPDLLKALDKPVINNAEEIASSPDARAIESVLQQLAAHKEDNQQRNWALHEDEHIIESALRRLLDLLHSSDVRVSRYVIRRHKYDYIDSLVEYYQMESRRSLGLLLVEVFLQICTLDPVTVINRLLISVLPLELAQDVYTYSGSDHERAKMAGALLTVIFSRGEPLPVHYLEPGQIGSNFVDFVLEVIEKPVQKRSHDLSDVFIGMMLSYNLQFQDNTSNVFIDRLGQCSSGAKTYTEKILLLLNREDDPAAVIGRDHLIFDEGDDSETGDDWHGKSLPNSVVKVIMDMFGNKNCRNLFYTNDLYVLIDIIVRQMNDLSTDDPRYTVYVVMCQLVLKHTNYDEHLHRFKDLQERFMRILEGDESTKEKDIVTDICKEVPAFSSLTTELNW